MKKLYVLALLAIAGISATAQTNFALSSNGSTATSTFTDDANAMLAIDDKTSSRWEAPAGKFADAAETDCQWTLDMGQARTFDMFEIVWEGAYSKSFTIEVSANGADYTEVVNVENETLAGFPNAKKYFIDEVTAQYVKFTNKARGTGYGVSFWEFRVGLSSEVPDYGPKIDLFSDLKWQTMVMAHEGTSTGSQVGAFDDNLGSVWQLMDDASEETRDREVGFTIDLGAYYTINCIDILFEGASAQDYYVDLTDKNGNVERVIDVHGPGGILAIHDITPVNAKDIRLITFVSTKAGTQWGVKIFDFSVYGEKTGEIEDTEAPTGFTAAVAGTSFASVTLDLFATDNVSNQIAYAIEYTDGETTLTANASGEAGKHTAYTVGGLKSNTAYTFNVVAKDTKGNSTAAVTLNATTSALAAAPAETVEGEVITIYSDVYGNAVGFYHNPNWGQATVTTEIELNGDHAIMMANTNYQGIEFAAMSFEGANTLHFDIYPMNCTSIRVTPIFWNPEANANFPEVPYSVTNLTPNQWNCVEIPVSAFGTNHAFITHQIKFDEGGNNTFIVDNIYYVKSEGEVGGEDPEDPQQPEDPKPAAGQLTSADWVTAGGGYAPNATYAMAWNVDKTITLTVAFEEEHVGLVPQIRIKENGDHFFNLVRDGEAWTWNSIAAARGIGEGTYEKGDVVTYTIYAAHSEGVSETKDLTFEVKETESMLVNVVSSDNAVAAVVYYNLQGVRVANPQNGMFIKVEGGKSSKVLVK